MYGGRHVDCAALGPADRRPGSDTSSAPSTGNGLRRAASPRPPPTRTVDEARAGEHIEDLLALGFNSARAGVGRGCWCPAVLTSDDGRSSPVTRPAWQAGATPTWPPSGCDRDQERRVRGSIPAGRQLFPARPAIVCAVCNSCSRRSPLALERARIQDRFRASFFAANSRSEPLRRALRQAVRCELYNPSRRQAAHLAWLCAAIRLLQNPQPILCGELAPLRLGLKFRSEILTRFAEAAF